jgi:hypothetical protein
MDETVVEGARVPSLDVARGRARLSFDHIAVLGALLAGTPPPTGHRAVRAQLIDAGLLGTDGVPAPTLMPIMRVLANASVIIDVQTIGVGGIVGHGAWATLTEAVTADGWPGDAECEYAPMDLSMLPWALARTVGLHRSAVPEWRADLSQLRVPAELVDGALSAVADVPATDAPSAEAAVRRVLDQAGRLPHDELQALAEVLLALRVFWRVAASWVEPTDERVTRSLAVLDAGAAGYWRHEQPAPPADAEAGEEVLLTRRSATEVWRELVDLLPRPPADPQLPFDDRP